MQTVENEQPLLLLDVDGVVSLWGFDTPHGGPAADLEIVGANVDGIPHFLSNAVARRISRLSASFRCCWCTGWEDRADMHLPHLLGLPRGWPHLVFGDGPADADDAARRHWKLAAIESYTGPDRAVAWVDDQFDPTCHEWAAARPGPTLLVRTSPASGLTEAHVEQLEAWATGLACASASPRGAA